MNGRAARQGRPDTTPNPHQHDSSTGGRPRPSATQLAVTPGAFLSRTDLRALGLERRAVDAIFRELPVVSLPGYSRPLIEAEDYRALIAKSTYSGDRVRPCRVESPR